jgi:cytochrome P450
VVFWGPTVADLDRLPYTDSVVKETLRLYPPIGRIGRRPVRDLDPLALGKDAAVFLSPFVTGRDRRWFSGPRVRSVVTLKPRGAVWMIVEAA